MTHHLAICMVQGDKFGYSVNFDLHPMAASCNPGHVRVSKLYVQVRYTRPNCPLAASHCCHVRTLLPAQPC
jgi:hypothetical protein